MIYIDQSSDFKLKEICGGRGGLEGNHTGIYAFLYVYGYLIMKY
jgi:hypothetical protein